MNIKVLPLNVEFKGNSNQSLLELLLGQGIKIRSLCKGVPSCAECRVTIVDGLQNLLPPSQAEVRLIGNASYLDGSRLACQCRLFGPVTVDISDHLKADKEALKKIKGIAESQLRGESQAVVRTLILDVKDGEDSEGEDSNRQIP